MLFDVGILRDEAGRDPVFAERENPDPTLLLEAHVDDDGETVLEAAGQFHVPPMGPNRGAIELFARGAPAVLRADESVAATGVEEEARGVRFLFASGVQRRHANPIAGTRDVGFDDGCLLPHVDASFRGVLQQDVIELAAEHLKREVRLVLDHVIEAPGGGDIPVAIDKAHARFADEIFL